MPIPEIAHHVEPLVRVDEGRVTWLILNQPRKYNPLSLEVLQLFQTHLADIAQDDTLDIVVIGAVGKAFSAGHDLRELQGPKTETFYRELFAQCTEVMLTLHRIPQVVVARVQGLATAAGCQLVAACDLAVASEEAKFATSGIRVGLFCSTPGVEVSRNLPRKMALEMLLTGEFIDAYTAQRYGLVNRVASPDMLDDELDRLLKSLLSKPSYALRSGKQLFYKQLEKPLEEAYKLAQEVIVCDLQTEVAQEGITAFLEKRAPSWSN